MAEEKTPERRSESQTMYFPKVLAGGDAQGYPFIQFKIVDRIEPESVSIFLYQPPGLSVNDGASYTNFDFGTLGAAAEFSGGKTGFTENDKIAAALVGKEAVAAEIGSELISKGTSIGALKAGIAINPYTRISFEGVNVRTHEFTFKLVAEDEDETEMAKAIERTFRKFLYPKRVGSIALQYPPMFHIKFFSNGQVNPYMPNIKPCYLTSLSSTFNESTNALFKKTGAPLEVSISLSFQEERTMVRQDLYEDDNTIEERDGFYLGD